jgi:thioredoxin 1
MKNISSTSEIPQDSGIVVVLKFEASWCGPCKRLTPIVAKLAEDFPQVKFLVVDVDAGPELKNTYNIKSVPTLIFLKDNAEVQRVIGMSLIDPLRKILRDLSE